MSGPVRVQISRRKGFKLPENTVSVARPSKWGNPFKVGSPAIDLPFIVAKRMRGEIGATLTQEQAVEAFAIWLEFAYDGRRIVEKARIHLRGKNVACYCRIGDPCHGNVLLNIANQPAPLGIGGGE